MSSEPQWYEKYPNPSSEPEFIPNTKVIEALKSGDKSALILDVRRDDFKGGKIKTSLNIPAQSVYPSLNEICELAEQSNKKNIYVHCNRSSKGSRAWRVVGWLNDTLAQRQTDDKVKAYIIEGGIKEWLTGENKQVTLELSDEYDASVWEGK